MEFSWTVSPSVPHKMQTKNIFQDTDRFVLISKQEKTYFNVCFADLMRWVYNLQKLFM